MTSSATSSPESSRRFHSRELTGAPSTVLAAQLLSAAEARAAAEVIAAAAVADDRQAVSEQGRLRLKSSEARPGVLHLLQRAGAQQPEAPAAGTEAAAAEAAMAVGYAQLDLPGGGKAGTAELTVLPGSRGQGFGRHLVDAVLAEAEAADPEAPVEFWAHGGHPAAHHLAAAYGAELVRELRQMRRTAELPRVPVLPEGVTVRTFRSGEDDGAWLRLNALAFAHHPEQGSWTEQDLADRLAEPWFDPSGFFLAFRGEQLVGFHWTKVHPEGLGEVYVVGVDPAEQGSGLGRALTAVGLRHLAEDRKQQTVMLYVDADNSAAVRVYERLGFTIHEVDLMYRVQARRES
ncbi:mycothiol synthase [Kitasatospora sp. GP82]|uniref:mycothiol synthase n=1 Tax=Kitasatospora sp. GP82 TaxID=3035089 RepID=UPI0024763443|nr:mycothiol synthase [Kitasatospora sp. GP82]MDH6126338.1 mycothiol synthase [Kitasatospora sp. GP82]